MDQVNASSLIVVSNRLPFILRKNEDTGKLVRKHSVGGLVTAVAPVVIKSGGLWVGWAGTTLDPDTPIPESEPGDSSPSAGLKSSQVLSVNFTKEDHELYYNGCCNGTFWPLFHSMPDKAVFSESSWNAYRRVNELFAQVTLEALRRILKDRPDHIPVIWIHDYHLMLAANKIREVADAENLQCKIGFFLHIPFPPWDIFKIFPWEDLVLQGMLGCDLIGFHIEGYALNFMDACVRCLGCRVDRQALLAEHGGRTVRIRPLPIGIPFKRFEELAQKAPATTLKQEKDNVVKIVLGVDRLDYTKGLTNRLQGFERLLEDHPEHIEKVVLFQVAVPSRTDVKEYIDLKEEMDKLVGQINGRFSTPSWSPIRYIYGCVGQEELAGFYRDSDVALVTPMRDGMNIVAKEFVACRIKEPGVLILSPFAGAGVTMSEALLATPYEIGKLASVLHRALTMPLEEREARMNALRVRERYHDVDYWLKNFMKSIGTLIIEDGEDVLPTTMEPVGMDDFAFLGPFLGQEKVLCLLLDYDGTLAPIAPHPDLAKIPPETKSILERLSNRSDVFIAVISGRSVKNVKDMVGIDGLTYAGNHGLEILHPDGSQFVHPMPAEQVGKTNELLQKLQEEVCHDGAWVENKGVLLTYHFRATPANLRGPLVERAKQIILDHGFQVGHAHCALEVKPKVKWDKGRASIHILRTAFGVDWTDRIRVVFIGDDTTDEDAISALKGLAKTFRIVSNHLTETEADKRLPTQDSVMTLLRFVERHMASRKMTQDKSGGNNGQSNLPSSPNTSFMQMPH